MKSYLVSHNACSFNCFGVVVRFRLFRSRNASCFWFNAEFEDRCSSYQSLTTDSSTLCLSNLACFVSFLGGKLDYTGYADAVSMLEELFSDVVFAEGIIK